MRQTIRLLLITLFSAAAVAAVGAEPTRGRWAVIATNPVLESGLSDLLTVKLSQDNSIQLVERERLRDATRELQLDSLMKAENVHQRLQLGKTLGAESLLVLSTEQQDGQQLLRVVVSDSTLGVRLWDGRFLNDDSDIEGLADQCVAVVAEVRQRFAGGIQRIFAVPPFLSEDFKQQFDYLQSRHRDVLSSALMAHAGVAVVEIEEAQAILRELEDTLSAGLERPIATIVEGKYRVTPADEMNQRRIELQVELVSGKHREQIKKTLQFGAASHWLTTSLTNRLLSGGAGNTDSLSAKTQREILARHAQRFAELGDWERSVSLREAALALDPDDALQRGLLISEYQYGIAPLIFANWHGARLSTRLGPELRAAALQHAADDYVVALNHLEYLIRNKLVTRADAIGLFQTQCWYLRNAVGEALPRDPDKHAALQPACVAQRYFLREVGTELDKLPPGRVLPERLSTPFYGIQYTLTQHVLSDVAFNNYSADSLESLRYLLEEIVPEDAKASGRVLGRMTRTFSSERRLDSDAYRDELKVFYEKRDALRQDIRAATDDQIRKQLKDELAALRLPTQPTVGAQQEQACEAWLSYLRRLTQSDREVVKLYGHWGLFKAPVKEASYFTSQARIASLPPLIENVERQLAEVKRLDRIGKQALTSLERDLAMAKNRIRVATSPPTSPKPSPSPTNKSVARESFGRMRFDPISLVVEGEKPGQPPLIKGMLQCGEGCDAYWTNDQFFVMHQPGVLRELNLTESESEHALYRSVTWDGECIWMYAHGQGIIAVRPDGTRLATFNQTQHLPGYGKGFQLLGLSPSRALIVASFGKSNRAWCGILEVDSSGKQSVNVFFEAKYVAEGRLPKDAAADPKTAFQPVWIHRLDSRNGKDYALVGRRDIAGTLQIDLDTFDVSVSQYAPHVFGRHAFFSHEGHLLLSRGGNQLIHYFPPGRDGSVRSHVLANNINPYVDQLLLHEGWLYVPGRAWFRLDPDKRKPERLQPWPSHLPGYYASLKGGVSAHYGLIAYYLYKRPLYQVTILEEGEVDQTKGSEQ
jgi:hypothetical protein